MSAQHGATDRLLAARRWANDNAAVVLLACVVLLAVSLNRLSNHAANRRGPTRPTHTWYYDTTTEQIVTRPMGLLPTLIEDGRELWLVHVFGCGDCSQEPMEYYERCAPQHRERFQTLHRKSCEHFLTGDEESEFYDLQMMAREYSRDGVTWRPLTPEAEYQLTLEFERACGGSELKWCHPQTEAR